MSETYETLRDSATGEAKTAWDAVDRERTKLREYYRQLEEDPKFADDYKSEQAWARYQSAREKIEAYAPKAREALEKQARIAERFSIPMPSGESVITHDTDKIIAGQNEASRIVRRIDRMDTSGKGPFKPDRRQILQTEYKRGLELGGTQGAIICRGVLSAADELGIDADSVVDAFRNERHHKNLEDAQHAARLIQLISKQTPAPPFPRPGARPRGGDMHTGSVPKFLAGGAKDKKPLTAGGPQYSAGKSRQGRRRAWK